MKKNTKMSEAEEGPDRRFPFWAFPQIMGKSPIYHGFSQLPSVPSVPRGSPWFPGGSQVLPQRQLLPTPPGERGPPAVSRRRGEIT